MEYKTKLCDSFWILQKAHQTNATLKQNSLKNSCIKPWNKSILELLDINIPDTTTDSS